MDVNLHHLPISNGQHMTQCQWAPLNWPKFECIVYRKRQWQWKVFDNRKGNGWAEYCWQKPKIFCSKGMVNFVAALRRLGFQAENGIRSVGANIWYFFWESLVAILLTHLQEIPEELHRWCAQNGLHFQLNIAGIAATPNWSKLPRCLQGRLVLYQKGNMAERQVLSFCIDADQQKVHKREEYGIG
jgi:hypothetical protein